MRYRAFILLGALFATAPAAAQPAPTGFGAEFLRQFNSSMEKVIQLAKAMPADKFGWSPSPGTMTVAKVYAHIAHYNYMYPANSLGAPAPDGRDKDATEEIADKAALVSLLEESRTHVQNVVKGLPADLAPETTLYGRKVGQWAVLVQLLAHMNEHVGQSVAYARMNGVVPPWSR